jgi:hypothetical protein
MTSIEAEAGLHITETMQGEARTGVPRHSGRCLDSEVESFGGLEDCSGGISSSEVSPGCLDGLGDGAQRSGSCGLVGAIRLGQGFPERAAVWVEAGQ